MPYLIVSKSIIKNCGCIQNTLISSEIMKVFNKLECYIGLGWEGLPGTNTQAYRELQRK